MARLTITKAYILLQLPRNGGLEFSWEWSELMNSCSRSYGMVVSQVRLYATFTIPVSNALVSINSNLVSLGLSGNKRIRPLK